MAAVASGAAILSVNGLAVGTQTIVAQYSGDNTWPPASRTIAITVSPASTSAQVSLTLVPGGLVLTGVVAAAPPGAGMPTGSIQFVDMANHAVIASAGLSSGKASAMLPPSMAPSVVGRCTRRTVISKPASRRRYHP